MSMHVRLEGAYNERYRSCLGIESSCDETAVSHRQRTAKKCFPALSRSQIDVHKEFGGVVPEVASRIHVENISMVIDQALKKAGCTMEADVDAVAVTQGPGLVGCLHIGLQAAKTTGLDISQAAGARCHHIAGHIFANETGERSAVSHCWRWSYPADTRNWCICKDENSFEVLGETQDDAIGEAFDKVARVMGLPYPGGPQIDRLAKEGNQCLCAGKAEDREPDGFLFQRA